MKVDRASGHLAPAPRASDQRPLGQCPEPAAKSSLDPLHQPQYRASERARVSKGQAMRKHRNKPSVTHQEPEIKAIQVYETHEKPQKITIQVEVTHEEPQKRTIQVEVTHVVKQIVAPYYVLKPTVLKLVSSDCSKD
jgi:hypothetical protein